MRILGMSQRYVVGALLAAMAFVLILLGGHTVVLTADQNQGGFHGSGNQRWVGTWATSPQATSDIRFANQTLRMIVRTSLGGNKVRVRFSNAYGAVPLVIGAAHIALLAPFTVVYPGYRFQPGPPPIQPPPPGGTCATVAGSAIVPTSDRVLTFGGLPSTKVFPGAVMVSDSVDLDVPALADLAVSFYLPNTFDSSSGNLITRHGTAKQTSYISASGAGDLTAAAALPDGTALTVSWFLVSTVEVLASEQAGVIVALGDSITDANVSTQDMNSRWPYELARRLNAQTGH